MSILIFIIVLSILIVVHELGHFIAAKRAGVKVEQFAVGFGPKLFRFKVNDTEYLICAIPLGGFVKLAGDNAEEFKGQPYEYLAKSVGQRARIIFCGPLLNYILAFLCFWLIFFLGFPNLSTSVGGLVEGFGAQEAGIQAGDKILSVDEHRVMVWQEIQEIIQKKKEADLVNILVLRDNQEMSLQVRIKQKTMQTLWGKEQTVGLIGIEPADEFVNIRYGFLESFWLGGQRLFYLTGLTVKSLGWIVLRKISFRQSVTGPLGIFYITTEAAKLGFIPLLQVVAIISMSLAIFNLLPLPVLDGGHILFLLIEKIRGRRIGSKTEQVITQIGFSIIILLVISVFYNDLLKFGIFDKIYQWWRK